VRSRLTRVGYLGVAFSTHAPGDATLSHNVRNVFGIFTR